MALAAGEVYSGGYVKNADGALVVVTYDAGDAAGYVVQNGLLRDADGRLVVVDA